MGYTDADATLSGTNIGNAKIEGLVDDLRMTQGQYNAW